MQPRYCLEQDNDDHWYLIPSHKKDAWRTFMDIPEDDERSWEVPKFARLIDGYGTLTFTDPIEE